jgi:16S rRNA (uracil1498-N3)-methyltransferase
MARLFIPPEKLLGTHTTLDEAAHRHLIKVLRLAPGAAIQVFDGAGTEIDAYIETVGKGTIEIALGERRRVPAPACNITLLQSLPRGERMDLIVQKTTELGVARISPVLTEYGMVKPPASRRQRWQTIAEEAARQSGRADVPVVDEAVRLGPALAQIADRSGCRFMLWEGERVQSLRRALAEENREVTLLVGPEGGFSDAEVAASSQAGFKPVGLGPRILRTETAAIVAVALAQAAAGGLES